MLSKAMVAASTKPMILSVLLSGEEYGYRILQRVKEMSGGTMSWSDNMLYPFLKRLEDDGFLAGRWQLSDEGRLRKYYRITDAGRAELEVERRQWVQVNRALTALWEPLPSLD
jgi:PadR family transcriptional regulator, regulatory protein PadR